MEQISGKKRSPYSLAPPSATASFSASRNPLGAT